MSALRFRYQTIEFGDLDIHLRTLKDRQQYDDPDNIAKELGLSEASWPLFGVVWDSSKILTNFMLNYDVTDLRILEVGCGMALTSLMLSERCANITATDHHPSAEQFLKSNILLNNGRDIPFVRTGWNDEITNLGKFDLIIGSDLLYERDHAVMLSGFINQHANSQCEVVIIDPGRGQSAKLTTEMLRLGYTSNRSKAEEPECLTQPFRGHILRYKRSC